MFRFTIRDVTWLMVAVGFGVSWWLERVPKTVEVSPHELTGLCSPGETVMVTIRRDGYDAMSADGTHGQSVRRTISRAP
jgi:hypothetical protein